MKEKGIKFMSHDMVKFNPMTKRDEFLYVRLTLKTALKSMWEEGIVFDDGDAAAASSGAQSSAAVEALIPTPPGKPDRKKTPVSPDDHTKVPKIVSEVDVILSTMRNMKARWSAAISDAKALIGTIDLAEPENVQWYWAKPATSLKAACKQVEDVRGFSDIHEAWCVYDVTKLRKSFTEEAIVKATRRNGEVANLMEKLEQESNVIKTMAAAKMAALMASRAAPKGSKIKANPTGAPKAKRSKASEPKSAPGK